MRNLYLDCDGVILDTIDKAYELMRRDGLDPKNRELVNKYFVDVDWLYLINEAGQLDNSIEKIIKLREMGIYDIKILTTCVNKNEPWIKTLYFEQELPGIPVITVPWMVRKDSVVDADNSILVDDSTTNVTNWRESGGIGLHFVKGFASLEDMQINDLMDIPKIEQKVKKIVRF